MSLTADQHLREIRDILKRIEERLPPKEDMFAERAPIHCNCDHEYTGVPHRSTCPMSQMGRSR